MAKEKKELVEIDKEEIHDYIDSQVKKYFSDEIDKANKKVMRYKNKKIITRDIIILILLIIILYLLHLLYTLNYFNGFINNEKEKSVTVVSQEKEEKKELSLEQLKEKYSYLIDNITISENSSYLNDYYEGNLTDELKLYLTLNNINIDKLSKEDNYNIIDDDFMKKEYNKLFDSEYVEKSFEYNNIKVRYINKIKSYISDEILEKEESSIKREITDIKVEGSKISITTIEGIVKDNTLYSINNTEIDDFNEDSSLSGYEEDLNKITYIFEDNRLKEIK